jgi:hypothetical protein
LEELSPPNLTQLSSQSSGLLSAGMAVLFLKKISQPISEQHKARLF